MVWTIVFSVEVFEKVLESSLEVRVRSFNYGVEVRVEILLREVDSLAVHVIIMTAYFSQSLNRPLLYFYPPSNSVFKNRLYRSLTNSSSSFVFIPAII